MPAWFIKDGATQITAPITHKNNLLLYSGDAPDDMKIGRDVVPLYKKNSKTDPSNYRPVSIQSVVSKILERVVYNQIESYMTSQNLFYDLQSGFRSSYSIDACFTYLTDHMRFKMDKGFYTGMVMIYLQKAFDTVDHRALLHKLKALGFHDLSVSWLESYLNTV